MKIIHTSDIHISSPLTTRLSPTQARERGREIIASFRQMTLDAIDGGASAVIIAGDLFDNERVSRLSLDTILGIIENASEVTFLYLPGNHEKNALISSGLEIPENLKIFGEEWTYFNIGNVTFVGRERTERNMFNTLSLDEKRKNILVLHGEIDEHSDANGKIGRRELFSLPVDYVALGHYHSYQEIKISDRCTAVYSGTPEGRGFDEVGDKGYVIVDVADTVSHVFCKASIRTLHIVEVDISDVTREIEIENKIEECTKNILRDHLVRVVLVGEHIQGLRRDLDSLNSRFEKRFYFFEVKDKTRLKISADDYRNDKSLKGEFIRLVLSRDDLSDKEKDDIIECGIRALSGEISV